MTHIASWARKRSKLFGARITVDRFNYLLNDSDLGLFGGDGEVIKELRTLSNIGMVALMAGCKSIRIDLNNEEEVEEILREAGLSCEVIEKE